jgi:hypothetical protein
MIGLVLIGPDLCEGVEQKKWMLSGLKRVRGCQKGEERKEGEGERRK